MQKALRGRQADTKQDKHKAGQGNLSGFFNFHFHNILLQPLGDKHMGSYNNLNTFRVEIETTIRTFYSLKRFNQMLADEEIVKTLNSNVYFWRIFESALITKLFMGLRRLFEDKHDVFSFGKFIRECKTNINEFSKHALESRRLEGQSVRPDYLDDFLKDAYEPDTSDFDTLAKMVRNHNKRMKGVYREIASKIFAHAIHTDTTVKDSLLSEFIFDEVEAALIALWSVYEQFFQMYTNGRRPLLGLVEYPYIEEVYNCIEMQIRK